MKKAQFLIFIFALTIIVAFNFSTVLFNWGPEVALACNGGCCPCNLTPRIQSCNFWGTKHEVVCVYGSGQCCPVQCQ